MHMRRRDNYEKTIKNVCQKKKNKTFDKNHFRGQRMKSTIQIAQKKIQLKHRLK